MDKDGWRPERWYHVDARILGVTFALLYAFGWWLGHTGRTCDFKLPHVRITATDPEMCIFLEREIAKAPDHER